MDERWVPECGAHMSEFFVHVHAGYDAGREKWIAKVDWRGHTEEATGVTLGWALENLGYALKQAEAEEREANPPTVLG